MKPITNAWALREVYFDENGEPGMHREPEQAQPVARVELMTTGGNVGLATRIIEIDDHLRERLRPGQLLYTAPPQRKPLTDEEIEELYFDKLNCDFKAFARAIESRSNIKE